MQGKVALVTGAARGLGKAFSDCLLKRGAQVCVSDVDEEAGRRTAEKFQERYGNNSVLFAKCDTSSQWEMERTFDSTKQRFGRLDLTVNNAGLMHERQWEKMLQVNLLGVIRGTLLGLRHMGRDQGGRGGHIVNISSVAGLNPVPFSPGYAASKHGVVAYTRAWGLNPLYEQHGVRVNCLCPYFAKTDILKVKEEHVYGLDIAVDAIRQVGVMEVAQVVAAFEALLDDPDLNGAVMKVSVKGHKVVEFPPTHFEHLSAKE